MVVEWRKVVLMGEIRHPLCLRQPQWLSVIIALPFYSQRCPRLEAKSYDHPIQRSCSSNSGC